MRHFCAFVTFSVIFLSNSAFGDPRILEAKFWEDITTLTKSACEGHLSALLNGSMAHRPTATEFPIDDPTLKDLNIPDLIMPILAARTPTALGQVRLSQMLKNTSLDAKEIRMRQEAIKELAGNPELLLHLETLFATFAKRQDEGKMAQHLSKTKKIDRKAALTEFLAAFLAHASWAAPLNFYLETQNLKWAFGMFVGSSLVTLMMNMIEPIRHIADLRERYQSVKHMVVAADKARSALSTAKSALLQEIGKTLESIDPLDHSAEHNRAARRYLRVQQGWYGNFLDFMGVSSVTMRRMNSNLDQHRGLLLRVGTAFSELSALVGLAKFAQGEGLIYPSILDVDQSTKLTIVEGHHPYTRADIKMVSVPNSFSLSNAPDSEQSIVALTGINTGGKSTALRTLAILLVIGQTGAPIPAKAAAWTPMAVLSSMNPPDSLADGTSFFKAQVLRIADVLSQLKDLRHAMVIIDEAFKGTSPKEHQAAEEALLIYLLETGRIGILATHTRTLANLAERYPQLKFYRVGEPGEPEYVLMPGVSSHSEALRVMVDAKMPSAFLDAVRTQMQAIK